MFLFKFKNTARFFTHGKRIIILSVMSALPVFIHAQSEESEAPEVPDKRGGEISYTLPYIFSFSPSFGFKYGQSEEIVYRNSKSKVLLSELVWEIKPMFYLGADFDFKLRDPMKRKGWFIHVAFQAGFPAETGYMTDKDWMAPGNGLSHLSKHNNNTKEAWFLDLTGGMSMPIRNKILLQFYAAINYMKLKWEAHDGYLQYASMIEDTYAPWNLSLPKLPLYGPVIYYEQDWWIFSPGISVHIPFSKYIEAGLYFQITPLIFCNDLDKHYRRHMDFTEAMFGGIMLEPRGEFIFSPLKWLSVSLNVSYRFIGGTRGDIVVKNKNAGSSQKYKNVGGAAYYVLDTGISVTLRY
jgi:outer membrane protease